ncbi:LysE family translocator [Actinoallomurus sp. CA-150999]|uniref:LysE family translocator n=1 Tax=Actinoallomurus sp. CA-150999 TaxID=3239887 RepID=UPI003D92D8A9
MTSLPAFAAASLLLILVPGPNLLYIITRSMVEGRRAGIASALGVETATLVHVAAAAFGLAALVSRSPVAFAVLRYAGAGYLAWLGVSALTSHGKSEGPATAPAPGGRGLLRAYGSGVLVNVLNPKVALFFLAFLPQFLPTGLGPGATRTRMLELGSVFLVIALGMDLCYALAGAALSGRLAQNRHRLRYPAAAVYLCLALLTAAGVP